MPTLTAAQIQEFNETGFLVVHDVVSQADLQILVRAVERIEKAHNRKDVTISWFEKYLATMVGVPLRGGPLARMLQYRPLLELVEPLVGEKVQVTGGLLLDKPPGNNWEIGWHQDSGIYVAEIPPGEPEDIRNGFPVLRTKGMEMNRNVSARLALDPSDEQTGGLYVLPGSHRSNLGKGEQVRKKFEAEKGVLAKQTPGSVLFYRPLTLHRSEKMVTPGRRRILHLQFGPVSLQLPGAKPYRWPQPVPLTPVDSLMGK